MYNVSPLSRVTDEDQNDREGGQEVLRYLGAGAGGSSIFGNCTKEKKQLGLINLRESNPSRRRYFDVKLRFSKLWDLRKAGSLPK